MKRWIVAIVGVAVAAIAVVVVIASGSDSGASAASGPDSEAAQAFRDCMSEHGADLPEPPSGAPGAPSLGATSGQMPAPDAATRQALQACRDLAPQPPAGVQPPGFGGGIPAAPPGEAPSTQN
jgi:hypothetical protein